MSSLQKQLISCKQNTELIKADPGEYLKDCKGTKVETFLLLYQTDSFLS